MANETIVDNSVSALEQEISFSWKRVAKRGVQNMVDDVDPAYKGAKMGVYALHGIPTWIREHRDGKLSSDRMGWTGAAGLFTLTAEVTGYALATSAAVAATGPVGFGVLAVPVASQLASYSREAFRRARKTEHANVVMTKVRKSLTDTENESFNLTNDVMIKSLADKLYSTKAQLVKREIFLLNKGIEGFEKEIEVAKDDKNLDDVQKTRYFNHAEERIIEHKKGIADLEEGLEKYKTDSVPEAREGLAYFAREVFDGLFADDKVGKDYEMTASLKVGPAKRRSDHEREWAFEESPQIREDNVLAKILYQAIEDNNGSANVQLLGQLTAVYDGKTAEASHYKVTPNTMWKKP